ncbi:alpha-ketoglutarate-dependent dioxygenase alkB homolog 6-like [Limulus polyphemus]|uniref:Alpha-ketoglutarate-dependent dioxygenase alkB homolog 6-like n=1 Tax=Limulus polyphemus TaxID=6850 RepID=A0ABM1B4B4_LIMPO|nr:alpha-ketoglutarate-dependent dioxygenase alkB homolog 6-like [Limulus polyphemus]
MESNIVKKVPPTVYYLPNFITAEEEKYLIDCVYEAPKPKWTNLAHRRLQNWGGLPHPKGMIPESLPKWLEIYIAKINSLGVFGDKTANHVLVNEYLSGQGIMPHEDGPLFYPTITTINLGSHTLLDFYERLQEEGPDQRLDSNTQELEASSFSRRHFASLLLEPRSLLIVKDDMYHNYLHGIKEVEEDIITNKVANLNSCETKIGSVFKRSTRISLTIRHVPKTLKNKFILGNMFR